MYDGEYIVRIVDLPPSVHGMISFDETDFASIYLNAHDTRADQQRALRHELRHLRRGDIYQPDVSAAERSMP